MPQKLGKRMNLKREETIEYKIIYFFLFITEVLFLSLIRVHIHKKQKNTLYIHSLQIFYLWPFILFRGTWQYTKVWLKYNDHPTTKELQNFLYCRDFIHLEHETLGNSNK